MAPKRVWNVLRSAVGEFISDDAVTLSAALAFYTSLSLAPLLLIAVWIASLVWGRGAENEAASRAAEVVGPQGAQVIRTVLANASRPAAGIAAVVGIAVFIFSASGVFAQLQYSLNRIWHVTTRPGAGVKGWLRKRFWTVVMLVIISAIFMASIVASAVLAGLQSHLKSLITIGEFWRTLNLVVPFLLFVLLFAMVYKVLPDVTITWRDVWFGAFVTAVLFAAGRYLIGWYIGRGGVASIYGAAGSLVALLTWLYYSALIFFFGAELTQVYARQRGARIQPSAHAVWIPHKAPAATDGQPGSGK
jgi:membrane protein